ncbi:MAG: type II/IV secretion system ATPase subunit [Methanimicrococcus sp.]|nr:type II/IV secretion system ATPase subunit [Methanimicrococcus sp.]
MIPFQQKTLKDSPTAVTADPPTDLQKEDNEKNIKDSPTTATADPPTDLQNEDDEKNIKYSPTKFTADAPTDLQNEDNEKNIKYSPTADTADTPTDLQKEDHENNNKYSPTADTADTPTDLQKEDDEKTKTVEEYPIRPPFSFAKIKRKSGGFPFGDEIKNEPVSRYIYEIHEPVLSPETEKLCQKIKKILISSQDPNLFQIETKNGALRSNEKDGVLKQAMEQILKIYRIRLLEDEKEKIYYQIHRDFLNFGKIQPLLEDENIEDISCSGNACPIFIFHKRYGSVQTNLSLGKEESEDLIRKMAQRAKKHISVSEPLTDAILPDGSRAQLTLGDEITSKGSTFTIRKFNETPYSPADLVANKTFTPEIMAYLWFCVNAQMNILFVGGTACGKTTSLNAVCRFIPLHKKIVSIEDTQEINLPHQNWIPSLTREKLKSQNTVGDVSLYDLLKTALRQRPEYLLVGEIRGAEAYVLFQAMSTGHTTLSTMHADSVETLIHRLENPPMNVPRAMIQTLDVVVILNQREENENFYKRCAGVYEILETDPYTSEILTREIFKEGESLPFLQNSSVLKRYARLKNKTPRELKAEYEKRVSFFQNPEEKK